MFLQDSTAAGPCGTETSVYISGSSVSQQPSFFNTKLSPVALESATALNARALLAPVGRMTVDGVLGTLKITSQGACNLGHTKAAPMPLHMKRALGSTPVC